MTSGSLPSEPGEPAVDPEHSGAQGTPETQGTPEAPLRRRRWWLWGLTSVLVLGAVLGVLFVPTPYVLIQPGAVRPAEDRVEVEGAPSYTDDGAVLFTTVYVDEATLFGLLRGSLDDAIEVRTQEEVYGSRGRDETREINRAEMDLSKLIATREALDLLGYEAEFTANGARVIEVLEDAPAGSLLEAGDVIVGVDGTRISVPADLRAALEDKSPGDTVSLSLRRPRPPTGESAAGGAAEIEAVTVEAPLTTPEDGEERAVLGVSVEPADPRIDSEVQVEIDSGAVTGPSAGLAWSLAVIDALTPGSLTDGREIAVTGEILGDGSIGVIGGTVQKVATVSRNGVDVFLYPADTPREEQEEMRRVAGDDVELVPVATLADAIEFLAPGGLPEPD